MTTLQVFCLVIVYGPLLAVYLHQRNNLAYVSFGSRGRPSHLGLLAAGGLLLFILASPTLAPRLSAPLDQERPYPWTHLGFEISLCVLWLVALFYLIFPHVAKRRVKARTKLAAANRQAEQDTLWQQTLGISLTLLASAITLASALAST